jgi:tRNA-specific 2-thiouridylase
MTRWDANGIDSLLMGTRIQAIGLVSGGLDSALAVAVVKRQGIGIIGLHYFNGFAPEAMRSEMQGPERLRAFLKGWGGGLGESLGVPVELVDVSEAYLGLLLSPKHGFGANVNPCIDCRIFMLKDAKRRMEETGASFIFTGEVLGQRPMSQHRGAMNTVERESGLVGRLLRPLSAKLLPETIPERDGLIDRELLLDIQGRSRKRQMALAEELGITGYSQPAGGCTLTDENYARKFKDMISHAKEASLSRRMAVLLALGRHLRLSDRVAVVVGREKIENHYIENNWSDHWLAFPADVPGPTSLVLGEPTRDDLETAAAVTARYSDAKHETSVRILLKRGDEELVFDVRPAADEEIDRYRV